MQMPKTRTWKICLREPRRNIILEDRTKEKVIGDKVGEQMVKTLKLLPSIMRNLWGRFGSQVK